MALQRDPSTLGVLLCCIVPATVATLFWMRKLPEDPDRATLVSNLFLEIWALTIALRMLVTGEESFPSASYFDFASLTIIGSGLLVVAVMLYRFPGVWGSVELVTWTLNMGVIGVEAGTAGSGSGWVRWHHHSTPSGQPKVNEVRWSPTFPWPHCDKDWVTLSYESW